VQVNDVHGVVSSDPTIHKKCHAAGRGRDAAPAARGRAIRQGIQMFCLNEQPSGLIYEVVKVPKLRP
jgi:hypothetical protein